MAILDTNGNELQVKTPQRSSNINNGGLDSHMSRMVGGIGTDIADNFYDEDFLALFNDFESRADQFEKMSRSDPVIKGLLRATINPIISASWNINFDDSDDITDEQKKQLDYIRFVIFDDLKFLDKKLFEILTFFKQGWSIFEKVFIHQKTKEFGDIISIRLPIRMQKTIETFLFGDKKRPDKVTHLRQLFSSNRSVNADIPIEKLLIFTLGQVGNDLSGESILRSTYKPWKQKDFTEHMQMIGIERMALGTPITSLPENYQEEDLTSVKSQVRNYMSNDKAGVFLPFGFGLDVVKGEMNNEAIQNTIDSKNTEMAISMLAQFLLLGQQNRGGAFSLGQDQSDFFLNSLEYSASIVINNMNQLIKELISIQFGPQDEFPKMEVKGVNNKASKEMADTLTSLTGIGLLKPDDRIQKFVRELYKLPEIDEEDIQEDESELPANLSESNNNTIQLQDFGFKENVYVKGITENENFIQDFFDDKYIPETEKLEANIQKILNEGYAKAKTDKVDGTEFISLKGNTGLKNDMKSKVKDQFKKFEKRLLGPQFADKIMNEALKNAERTVKDLSEIKLAFISQGEFNSFMAGHLSNIEAVFFNEERRMLENIESNFGNGLSLDVIKSQVDNIKLNRNILKLSVVAHPRAVFRGEILRWGESNDITNFKMLIPRNVKLDPAGTTIASVFLIKQLLDWEEKNADQQNGGGVVGGLGLHHGSQEYYLPIAANELTAAQELSRDQRKNLEKVSK